MIRTVCPAACAKERKTYHKDSNSFTTREWKKPHWARPKVHLVPVSNSGQKQNAWGKVWAQGKYIQYFPRVLSQLPTISRLEISGAKYVFMHLEPCKLPWVASFNSPFASPKPCALSRLILSDLLFICLPDALHPLHAGCMPLHTIHLNFPPLVLHAPPSFPILQTSPQLIKKMPKDQSHLLGLPITWELTLPRYKLSKPFGPRIHIVSHVSSPSPVLSDPCIFVVLCSGLVPLPEVYLFSSQNLRGSLAFRWSFLPYL